MSLTQGQIYKGTTGSYSAISSPFEYIPLPQSHVVDRSGNPISGAQASETLDLWLYPGDITADGSFITSDEWLNYSTWSTDDWQSSSDMKRAFGGASRSEPNTGDGLFTRNTLGAVALQGQNDSNYWSHSFAQGLSAVQNGQFTFMVGSDRDAAPGQTINGLSNTLVTKRFKLVAGQTDMSASANVTLVAYNSGTHPADWDSQWVLSTDGSQLTYYAGTNSSTNFEDLNSNINNVSQPNNLGLTTTKGEIFQGTLSTYAVIDSPFEYLPIWPGFYQPNNVLAINGHQGGPTNENMSEWWPNGMYIGAGHETTNFYAKSSSLSYVAMVGKYVITPDRRWFEPLSSMYWQTNIDDTKNPRIVKSNWHARRVEGNWTFALWNQTEQPAWIPHPPYTPMLGFYPSRMQRMDSQIVFKLKPGQTVFDTSSWASSIVAPDNSEYPSLEFHAGADPIGDDGSFVANWDDSTPIRIRHIEFDSSLHPQDVKGNWLVNDAGTELQFFYEGGLVDTGLAPMVDVLENFTGTWKESQTITFDPLSDSFLGAGTINLTATSSSGLPVTFTSSDDSIAEVAGSVLTLKALGTVSITASQAGDATYAAAASVAQPLVITKDSQTITFNPLTDALIGPSYAGTINLTATSSSGLPVTFTSSDDSIAEVAGSVLTLKTTGTVSITASQAGDVNTFPATDVTQSLLIQLDTDGDGIPDSIDPDDDNDGIADEADPYPLLADHPDINGRKIIAQSATGVFGTNSMKDSVISVESDVYLIVDSVVYQQKVNYSHEQMPSNASMVYPCVNNISEYEVINLGSDALNYSDTNVNVTLSGFYAV